MASNSSGLHLVADRLRFNQFSITIGEADGDDAVVAASDIVRVKIGRLGDTPLLEVQSDVATANGSVTTAANPTVLSIEGPDLPFKAGIYEVEASIWDTNEGRLKKVERGVFQLRDSMGGDITA